MKVRALRGVCIGVDRNLAPDDTDDLEPAMVSYLVSIGAVERVIDPIPVPEADAPESKPTPDKSGKKEK